MINKYLFFSNISLYRFRRDNSFSIENVNKVGFIGSSKVLEGDLRKSIRDAKIKVYWINALVGIAILFIAIIIAIVSSRIFANKLVDPFINLCIKMKIAQNTQSRVRRMQAMKKKVKLSDAELIIGSKTEHQTGNLFQELYIKIENILKVFKMKNFQLLEGDSKEYYSSAKKRYSQILEIYKKAEKDLLITKKSEMDQETLINTQKNVRFIIFNWPLVCKNQENSEEMLK